MYSVRQLLRGLRDPSLIANEFEQRRWQLYNRYQRLRGRRSHPVTEREWDTLVVLDACRYDLFAAIHDLPGDLRRHYSVASNTAEWLSKSFVGHTFPEVVYVTATPKYVRQDLRECFHDIVPVWQTDWDDDLRTVPPEVMTERVIDAHDRFPDKRILAHYVQPHIPFIGETGRNLPHEVVFAQTIIRQGTDEQNIWEALRTGDVDRDTVWRAYRENFELALPAVKRLRSSIEGRAVVTADHGNVFGEHGLYGHPPYRHVPELITVPWLVTHRGPRRVIEPGEIRSQAAHYREVTGGDAITDRLADLGYTE